MEDFIFILLRHIRDKETDRLWRESYISIRKFYPETTIMIIDDNSSYQDEITFPLSNCLIINSEYPGRGELLPYYYFYKLKPSKKAVFVHDSVFFNSKIDFSNIQSYEFFWTFNKVFDQDQLIIPIIEKFEDDNLVNFYRNKNLWNGCFGGMAIFTYSSIEKIVNEYPKFFTILLENIKCREERSGFERIIGCFFGYFHQKTPTIFGDIHRWVQITTKGEKRYDISFNEYLNLKGGDYLIMKVWTGR